MSHFVNRACAMACAAVALSASTALADGSGTNIIVNGGFETGDLTGWQFADPFAPGVISASSAPFQGVGGDFVFVGAASAAGQLIASFTPGATVAEGTRLCLEFDFSSLFNQSGLFTVGEMHGALGYLNNIAMLPMQGNAPMLTRYSFEFTASDSLVGIGFHWNTAPEFTGRWAIDNVSLSVVPAPGAVALLGLAGLAGRRRR